MEEILTARREEHTNGRERATSRRLLVDRMPQQESSYEQLEAENARLRRADGENLTTIARLEAEVERLRQPPKDAFTLQDVIRVDGVRTSLAGGR
jgi:predicted RNase H-like nuclease (RuvC/YqgF family)